jgi:glycine betaine/proline transport system substrate-binding protein
LVVTDPEPAPPTGQAHQVRRGEASAGDRDAVVLAQIDESFHQVGGGVVHETLLRLGHSVEIREGPHPEIYPLLGSGDVHLFATSWLPGGHGHYWAQVEERAVAVTPLYDGARFFWAVPDYVPEQQVASLADLTRPEVVDRMATLVVQGTTPGAGLTMRSRQLVTDYGLDQLGWRYEVGDLAAIIRTIDERVASQDWFVTPLWEPQYLNRVHRLRPLDDPRGVFPPPDQAWLTANHRAFQGLPATTQAVLRKIRFDITDTTAMDHAVNVDGLSTLQAARQWMDSYPEKVRAWLG